MRAVILAIASLGCLSYAETPEVIEHELNNNTTPIPFYRAFGRSVSSYLAASWETTPSACWFRPASMALFGSNGWNLTQGLELPVGSELFSARFQVEGFYAFFTIPDGTGKRIAIFAGDAYGIRSVPETSIPVTDGRLRQAAEAPDFTHNIAPCWLVDSPSGDFVEMHRTQNFSLTRTRTPVEKSKAIHNFFIDKVRTAYITTISYDGTVNHRQLFSGGQTRWHRAFPAETQVKVDVDGNTFALRSTPSGVVVARYDHNGNLVATNTLPLSVGRRIEAWTFEPLGYVMTVTSRPTSTGRAAYLVRLNPALDHRIQPIDGNLDPTIGLSIAADSAQTYVCATTASNPKEEIVQAFDTHNFVSRWSVRRSVGENEDSSTLLPTPYGLLTTNNRNGRGVSRKHIDHGFVGYSRRTFYSQGRTSDRIDIAWYQGVPEFRTIYITSSDPVRCRVPATYTFSDFRSVTIDMELAPVTTRTRYRLYFHDPLTATTRSVFVIVDP
ncbi:MAG: hypothetical protein ABL962_05930 [Fimbriimonadaceae bacterium]